MNEKLERVLKFLDEAQTYYLATVEGDQPRVRPFGTALIYNDKLYIQTGIPSGAYDAQTNQPDKKEHKNLKKPTNTPPIA